MKKTCEVCSTEIPESFVNALCMPCYGLLGREQGVPLTSADKREIEGVVSQRNGITDESYVENEEVDEIDLVSRSHGRFKGMGIVMPDAQRKIYEAIRDYCRNEFVTKHIQYPKFIWKPKVIDIGMGLGIGTNILSQEADYVLGTDKNEENVRWASQMFSRQKNNMYWSPQIDFMVSDVKTDDREYMKFDVVACIEVIEHFKDISPLIQFIKNVSKKETAIFISTPNRNAWKGQERAKRPLNIHHVKEYTSSEFKDILSESFASVEIYDSELKGRECETITPVVAFCRI